MPDNPEIGLQFQQQTKYNRLTMGGYRRWTDPPPTYKRYADPLAVVELPAPQDMEGEGLWQVVARRRSVRDFSDAPLSLAQLSQLLWATQGITGTLGEHDLRATGSAGALYPNETYIFTHRVEGCPMGMCHYDIRNHALAVLAEGDFTNDIAEACLGQQYCATAPMVFAWGAVVERCTWKYHERAYRYLYLDAGHIGAQMQLAACALGLGSVNIGAFFDDEVNALLGLDGQEETAVYLTCVGVPQ